MNWALVQENVVKLVACHYLAKKNQNCPKHCLKVKHFATLWSLSMCRKQKQNFDFYLSPFHFISSPSFYFSCIVFLLVFIFLTITKLQTMQGQGVDCVQYFIPPFIIPHLTRFELRNWIKDTLTNQTRPPISHFYLFYIIKVILRVYGSTLISLLYTPLFGESLVYDTKSSLQCKL